jgi:hypothetical protein
MKKSCVYITRKGMFPYGTTGDATHLGGDTYLFKPHGYPHTVTLDKSNIKFGPPLPKYPHEL